MRNFRVVINGNTYEVGVEELDSKSNDSVAVEVPVVKKESLIEKPIEKKVEQPIRPQNIAGVELKSPMPGVINKIVVQNGQTVSVGSPVVVLEAMKMENDIAATADGVVTVLVKQGDSVETGTVLAVIK